MAIDLDALSTAFIMIDLQHGIVGNPVAPRSGPEVVSACIATASRLRGAGATIVAVNVDPLLDPAVYRMQRVDAPMQPPAGGFPPEWRELMPGVAEPGDLRITKRFWGAFYATELDYQLRRRTIETVVVCGVSTNIGVETTVRQAYELGYEVVVPIDLCASNNGALHDASVRHILPRLARLCTADQMQTA